MALEMEGDVDVMPGPVAAAATAETPAADSGLGRALDVPSKEVTLNRRNQAGVD